MPQAFDGFRVIDTTHVLAGPFASYQLGVLGAEVIKVEAPEDPDQARWQGSDAAMSDAGMGTAFSSSLFGLTGSLILGFLDLQAGQAQNRFYNELEDWLTTLTDIEPEDSAGGGSGLVELRFAIDNLRKAVSEGGGGAGRNAAVAMANLAEGIQGLVQHVRSEQQMMRDWADEQSEQQKRIEHLLKTMSTAFERIKDEAK